MVLKMGQVEVVTSGDVHKDGFGSLFVTRAEIERVNGAVLHAGGRKIRAMQKSMEFRRSIVVEVWEHEVLKTRLGHVRTELYYVKVAIVTREVREVLRRWKAGIFKDDKTTQKMEREFEATRRNGDNVQCLFS